MIEVRSEFRGDVGREVRGEVRGKVVAMSVQTFTNEDRA